MSPSQAGFPSGESGDLVHAAQPITAIEAASIAEEARHRSLETSEEVSETRRHGRVEVETHRVSEEMTRRAQEQLRLEADEQPAPNPATNLPERHVEEPEPTPSHALPVATPVKRILVPISGADVAERALPFAATVARMTEARLTLVHLGDASLSLPPALLDRTLGIPRPEMTQVEIMREDGAIAQQVLALEAPDRSDVVVLAPHFHFGMEGEALGRVATALVRRGCAPVLLIPPQLSLPEVVRPRFARILVPLDGSLRAEEALARIVGMVMSPAATAVDAAHAVREIVLLNVGETQRERDDASRYLDDTCQRLRQTLPTTVSVSVMVEIGSAPGAIVDIAEHGSATGAVRSAPFDLVALATHGRSGFGRWLLGSVAEYVLTHVAVPVLVIRPARIND